MDAERDPDDSLVDIQTDAHVWRKLAYQMDCDARCKGATANALKRSGMRRLGMILGGFCGAVAMASWTGMGAQTQDPILHKVGLNVVPVYEVGTGIRMGRSPSPTGT